MSVDQKIIEKVKKLLSLSGSSNENEATLALIKAKDLMNEHNLTTQDVAADGSGADVKDRHVWGLTKSRQKWESMLGSSVAVTFDGRAVFTKTGDGWYFTFIASKTDMALIVDLFERLRQTVRRMSDSYVKAERSRQPWMSAKTLHNSYRRGVVLTIHNRLQELKENTRPDSDKVNLHGLTGMDLVVVKNQAVEQRLLTLFGKTRKAKSSRITVDGHAYSQGKHDGNNVSLHRSLDGSNPATLTT